MRMRRSGGGNVRLAAAALLLAFAASEDKDILATPPDAAPQEGIEVQDNVVELGGVRYKLRDISRVLVNNSSGDHRLCGITEEYPDRMSLDHPYLWTYFIQVFFAIVASFMALYAPRCLVLLLVGSVVVWPVSGISNESIYAMQPGDFMWWMMCAKSLIVNIAPTLPMMLVLITNCGEQRRQFAGLWVYFILWANVAWTLGFPMPDAVMKVNGATGACLCVSLIIHIAAMIRRGIVLFEVKGQVLYGYGTSLSWLLCYTVWNALFVGDFAVGLTLQDILFWCMMFHFYYHSGREGPIELYFAMARPIQLSMYIAVSDWTGLIPFFREAIGIGHDVNRHAYTLFIAIMNCGYSAFVMAWEIYLLANPTVSAFSEYPAVAAVAKDGENAKEAVPTRTVMTPGDLVTL